MEDGIENGSSDDFEFGPDIDSVREAMRENVDGYSANDIWGAINQLNESGQVEPILSHSEFDREVYIAVHSYRKAFAAGTISVDNAVFMFRSVLRQGYEMGKEVGVQIGEGRVGY